MTTHLFALLLVTSDPTLTELVRRYLARISTEPASFDAPEQEST